MSKIHLNIKTVSIGVVITAFSVMLLLWISELGGLWIKGISYVANDVENYYNNAFPVEGEYKVEIDLIDLKSNEGKLLYEEGENKIYESEVIFHNDSGYEVYFRSSGKFGLDGATLVSGIEHAWNDRAFTSYFHASAQAKYKGEKFKLNQSGSSGLNYRDGDEFGFYLFPLEKEVHINSEEREVIELTITNLYINLWAKKL